MKLKISKLDINSVVLTNESDVFAGTDLANENFSVEVKPLTKVDTINLMQNCVDEVDEDTNKINIGKYTKLLFTSSVINADGFTDENDEVIEFGDELKEYLWEVAPDKLVSAIRNIIDDFKKADEEKKSEEEDLTEPMQNGLPYQN
jgi:hypothetical protein